MEEINGYPLDLLYKHYFSRLDEFTKSNIDRKLEGLKFRLEKNSQKPILISLGENCGPAVKIRDAGLSHIGSNFFDNLVVRADDILEILNRDFCNLLMLRNLEVFKWEGNDSVFDIQHRIFFHHYFHLPGSAEKDRFDKNGVRSRRIDEADIALFLPGVRAQFEYLQCKFMMICISDAPKIFIIRNVEGNVLSPQLLEQIEMSLTKIGTRNFTLINVFTHGIATIRENKSILIAEESGIRWGETERWKSAINSIIERISV